MIPIGKIRARAYELHRCPPDYEGPCWGPTDADLAEARRQLEAEASRLPDTGAT